MLGQCRTHGGHLPTSRAAPSMEDLGAPPHLSRSGFISRFAAGSVWLIFRTTHGEHQFSPQALSPSPSPSLWCQLCDRCLFSPGCDGWKAALSEAENKMHPAGRQIKTGLPNILNWINQTLRGALLGPSLCSHL